MYSYLRENVVAQIPMEGIIPVEMAEHVILKANGIPLFKTRLATSNGNLALKVEDVYQQAE